MGAVLARQKIVETELCLLYVTHRLSRLILCLALVRVSRSVNQICGLYLKVHRSLCESCGLCQQRAIPHPICDCTAFSSSIARHCTQRVNEHAAVGNTLIEQ